MKQHELTQSKQSDVVLQAALKRTSQLEVFTRLR
jgi:hypothetical protein